MKISRLLTAVAALAPLLLAAQAPGPDLKQVVAKLEANVARINTYQAKFSQEVRSEQFAKTLSKGGGELFFQKPGKMAWHYNAPEEHWYITEGKVFWDYLPDAKQAMMLKLDDALASNLPRSFLFGMGKLSAEFEIDFHPDQVREDPKLYHLVLVPRKEQDKIMIGTLELSVDAKTFLVAQARLKDAMGNESTMSFSEIKVNPKIDPAVFRFTPPKGVEVIKASEPDALKPKPKPGAARKKPAGKPEK